MKMKIKDFFEKVWYYIYHKGIYRIIPSYNGRTIFTRFYWRTLRDRMRLGFDETETWSLDYSLTKLIAPRIAMFVENGPYGSLPGRFLEEEYKKSIANGYEWDSHKWELKDKAERKRCWKRAEKAWYDILNKIKDGFEDDALEGKDWDAWNEKWKPVVTKINKNLQKAKTQKEAKAIWDSIKSWREYRADIVCCTDDVVYNMRKEARFLLAEYYHELWW